MGLSALGALIAIALAFLAQSPRMLTRFKLNNQRLDLRARALTGYGLALLLLAFGFFVAGVPLDSGATEAAATGMGGEGLAAGTIDASATLTETLSIGGDSGAMVGLPTPASSGGSGAMIGLATPAPELTGTLPISGTAEFTLPPGAETGEPAATAAAEGTDAPTATPTPPPTATATPTPAPTLTPTPIFGPTALVGDETSNLPVRQLPGGAVLVVLVRGDVVLPLSGHAFHTGEVWREISTVNGVIGWVPERFLVYPAPEE